MKSFSLLLTVVLFSITANAQSYHLEITDGVFHLGMNSSFSILCGPRQNIGLEEITVLQHTNESFLNEHWFLTEGAKYNDSIKPLRLPLVAEYGRFRFRMLDDLPGIFDIIINDGEIIDTLRHGAEPLPAKVYVGNKSSNADSIPARVLKAQRGLWASIECCGFEAKCPILGYEVTAIKKDGHQSVQNLGGAFSEATAALIQTLTPGDMVTFRFIRYRCSGADTNGQRAPNMVFTIK